MEALAVFTNRGLNRVLTEGGTQAWSLKPERVTKLRYVVCTQNRDDGDWGDPTHAQGQGFLIGKISAVEPSPEGRKGRYIVRFSEYAEIDKPDMAYKWRNPVRYIELEDFDIDPTKLTFKPVPQREEEPPGAGHIPAACTHPKSEILALDLSHAKIALAEFYKVPVTSIEITIRG